MTDDEIIANLVESGADDWLMLHDVLWESTHDDRTETSKATVVRVLARTFSEGILVPGDLGESGFEDWDGTPTEWLQRAEAVLEASNWQPMGDGFWLRLTPEGEKLIAANG